MWDYKVMQDQWRQRALEVQEQLSENAVNNSRANEQSAERFSLERYETALATDTKAYADQAAARELSADQSFSSAQSMKDEGEFLVEGRMNAKGQGKLLEESAVKHTQRQAAAQAPADVRQTLQLAKNAATGIAKGQPQLSTMRPMSAQNTAGQGSVGGLSSIKGDKDSSEDSFTILDGQKQAKKAANDVFGGGTQCAITRQPNTMPTYFSTQADARRDEQRAWNRPSYEMFEEAVGAAAAANRQGAIVAPAQGSYSNLAMEQTLMPRLAELVQRLSAMGYSWARVVVPVDAQTKVVVRFNTENGRVKIHFSSPSEGLCEVIRNCWSALTNLVGQTGISLDQPTFDAQNYE